ncbi:hypothetical protein ACFL0W_03975 [Nanoarchaeota archaeon]
MKKLDFDKNVTLLAILAISAVASLSIMVLVNNDFAARISFWDNDLTGRAISTNKEDLPDLAYKTESYYFFDIGETGIIRNVNHNLGRIKFLKKYDKPVIIAKPVSLKDPQPAHTRISQVTKEGFSVKIEEWDYLDTQHGNEDIFYFVVEKGKYEIDGKSIEADFVQASDVIKAVNFENNFKDIPVVFSVVEETTYPIPLTTMLKDLDESGFYIMLQKEEKKRYFNTSIPEHLISYIAMDTGEYLEETRAHFVGRTERTVNHNWHGISLMSLKQLFSFIAEVQTSNGADTADIRYKNLDSHGVEIMIQEERSLDSETRHNEEIVGYLISGALS